jgi:hypothetical protein
MTCTMPYGAEQIQTDRNESNRKTFGYNLRSTSDDIDSDSNTNDKILKETKMESFINEAVENNLEVCERICKHYGRTIDELKFQLKCRVSVRRGKTPYTKIHFTDNQTNLTIKWKRR